MRNLFTLILLFALIATLFWVLDRSNKVWELEHQRSIWKADAEIAGAELALFKGDMLLLYQANQENIIELNKQISLMDAELKYLKKKIKAGK